VERIRNVPDANREQAFINARRRKPSNQTVRPVGNSVRPFCRGILGGMPPASPLGWDRRTGAEFSGKTPSVLLSEESEFARHFGKNSTMAHFSKTGMGRL
jgi:hypothetical protein